MQICVYANMCVCLCAWPRGIHNILILFANVQILALTTETPSSDCCLFISSFISLLYSSAFFLCFLGILKSHTNIKHDWNCTIAKWIASGGMVKIIFIHLSTGLCSSQPLFVKVSFLKIVFRIDSLAYSLKHDHRYIIRVWAHYIYQA